MKKLAVGILVGLSVMFVSCNTYDSVENHQDTGVITNVKRKRFKTGTSSRVSKYVYIKYKGKEYGIKNARYYYWALDKIGEQVYINVKDFTKDGEIIDTIIDIDEYSNKIGE